ncbi:hypothetical protein [Propylenella binzhouense]|uniref:hypothetical protein n=1 Tax=Propylenella binzhouense TaxID=2555902 RepID=UPI0019684323|nr:hypothetical protein [Propylenella binzhouense]
MRRTYSDFTRQVVAVAALSALAVAAMLAAAGFAKAADLPGGAVVAPVVYQPVAVACPVPQERVIFFDRRGVPTSPARTPYFYCVTGTMLMPGDVPPPPEYCCPI